MKGGLTANSHQGAQAGTGNIGHEIKVVGFCTVIGVTYVSLLFWLAGLAHG